MLRSLAFSTASVALLAGASLAHAATYEIDTPHSTVGFSVKHMMVSTVHGAFGKVTGTASWDKKDLSDAKVDATVDVASVDTREPKRDEHLKSPDFFDVAKFPTMTFHSKRVEKGSGNHVKLVGDLTIHGVTKEVTFDATVSSEIKDPWGNTRVGVEAAGTVSRKDFGLRWNKALETGGVVVGDDVKIELNFELIKKDAAKAAR